MSRLDSKTWRLYKDKGCSTWSSSASSLMHGTAETSWNGSISQEIRQIVSYFWMLLSICLGESNGSHVKKKKKKKKTSNDLLHISSRYKSAKELSDNNRILKITVLNGDCLNRNACNKAIT